jgi:hypothetical protein
VAAAAVWMASFTWLAVGIVRRYRERQALRTLVYGSAHSNGSPYALSEIEEECMASLAASRARRSL